jgi:hypothetical protein
VTESDQTPERVFVRHIDLPSGGSVDFRDPEDLIGDDHRRIIDTIRLEVSGVAQAMDTAYGAACMLIEKWDIPYTPRGTAYEAHQVPVPETDFALLGRLRWRDYHAVLEACAPAVRVMFPARPTPDDATTPGSPTVPANV